MDLSTPAPWAPGQLVDRLRAALDTPAAATGGNLLGVGDDVAAVAAWLRNYEGSPHTWRTYARDAERFLCWLSLRGRDLNTLTLRDVHDYGDFLAEPTPAAFWCSPAGLRRGDPAWRPFNGPLAPRSIRQTLANLGNLCGWLQAAQYLAANPFTLDRRRHRRAPVDMTGATIMRAAPPPTARYLQGEQWEAVRAAIEALPRDGAYRRGRYHAQRWALQLLYYAGLRRHEAISNGMAAFSYNADARSGDDGVTGWSLTVVGKGGRVRVIPVSEPFLHELQRYRRAQGWAPLPGEPADARRPLIVGRGGGPVSGATVYNWTKEIFERAAAMLDGPGADRLRQASAHWLRHTRATRLANSQLPLHQVQQLLGHANIQTTAQYTHAEARQLARAINAHDREPPGEPVDPKRGSSHPN